MHKRIQLLVKELEKSNVDAIFITGIPNIRYISNFSGEEGFLLITKKESYLLVDSRFTIQAESEVFKGINVYEYKGLVSKTLENLLYEKKIHWLAIEKERISYNLYKQLEEIYSVKIVPTSLLIDKLRMIKDKDEIEIIKKAFEISTKAFNETLNIIKEGLTEKEIASELEYRFKKNGGDKTSFDTIIASGERGALPHGVASDKKIKSHEPIVFDFGTYFRGYASDTTRVVSIGKPKPEVKNVYKILKDAQNIGVENAKKGVKAKDLDTSVRDYLNKNNLNNCFSHGLGHGVGIEIHELPIVNGNSEIVLEKNMVITIEPGAYFKDKFGLRIEDTIIIGEEKPLNLVELPHDIIII